MHWEAFKEKAAKINKKYFFKRTNQGYEVWDIALVYGPGFPRKYKIMLLPFKTNAIGFSLSLKKLKQGEWNRRLARQMKLTQMAINSNDLLKAAKDARFSRVAKEISRLIQPLAKKIADERGISETRLRLNMKDIDWDDTKKKLHQIMEARGVYS